MARGKKRVWLWVVVGIVIIFATVDLAADVVARRMVPAKAEEALGVGVAVDGVSVGLLGGRARVSGLSLAPPEGFERSPLSVDSITAVVSLPSILRGVPALRSVSIEGPTIVVEKAPDGRVNLAGLARAARAPAGGAAPGEGPMPSVGRLLVEGGRVVFVDRTRKPAWETAFDFSVDASDIREGAGGELPTTVALKADLGAGAVEVAATGALLGGPVSFDTDIKGEIPAADLAALAPPAPVRPSGGKVLLDGHIACDKGALAGEVAVTLDDFQVEAASAAGAAAAAAAKAYLASTGGDATFTLKVGGIIQKPQVDLSGVPQQLLAPLGNLGGLLGEAARGLTEGLGEAAGELGEAAEGIGETLKGIFGR